MMETPLVKESVTLGAWLSAMALPDATLRLTDAQSQQVVSGLAVDTRQLIAGQAFFALQGHQFDGRPYIPQAIEWGAAVIFKDGPEHRIYAEGAAWVVEWPQLLENASALASVFWGLATPNQSNPMKAFDAVMAVTGTNGKTTCSHLYAQLWLALGKRPAMIGTLGCGLLDHGELEATGYTTPDAITLQKQLVRLLDLGANVLSMEASSHSLHQSRTAAVPVSTAVFTNLTRDHLDYHGTMQEYASCKARLFQYPQVKQVVINKDDPYGRQWLKEVPVREGVRWWSYSIVLPEGEADVVVESVTYFDGGIRGRLLSPWGQSEFRTSLIGHFNLSNLLSVITAVLAEGAPFEAVIKALPSIKPVTGRMELMDKGVSESLALPKVVIDYAHTPDGLEQALSVIQAHAQGKIWCVFGCGGDRDGGKRPLMGEIAARLADVAVITNDNPRSEAPETIAEQIVGGIASDSPSHIRVELDRAKAIAWAVSEAQADDWVLIAGKGHEDYQILADKTVSFSDHQVVNACLNAIENDIAADQE